MSTSNDPSSASAPEVQERAAALRRGRATPSPTAPARPPRDHVDAYAFAALAENVRDYAIFLLDPSGVISYWGEGARLMKWWTVAQAEGSHLRFLYPAGGSEDGTAEAHLEEAATTGEYSGEGRRVRADGSTFWAGVTLTALRDPGGKLLGFAKLARDLTVRRAAEAALALAWSAAARRDAALSEALDARDARDLAQEDAAFALEQVRSAREYASQVLEPELVALQTERASLLGEMAALNREIEKLTLELTARPPSPAGPGGGR